MHGTKSEGRREREREREREGRKGWDGRGEETGALAKFRLRCSSADTIFEAGGKGIQHVSCIFCSALDCALNFFLQRCRTSHLAMHNELGHQDDALPRIRNFFILNIRLFFTLVLLVPLMLLPRILIIASAKKQHLSLSLQVLQVPGCTEKRKIGVKCRQQCSFRSAALAFS